MLQTVSLYTVFTNNSARKSGPPKYIVIHCKTLSSFRKGVIPQLIKPRFDHWSKEYSHGLERNGMNFY